MILVGKRFLSMLGVHDQEYEPGDIIVIRGKRYRFPSWTHVFDATRGNLRDYEVDAEAKPLYALEDDE